MPRDSRSWYRAVRIRPARCGSPYGAARDRVSGDALDDALLVSRAMAGDLDSFGQLYDRYFGRVYDFAWRILRDPDEAGDATQDIFMKAMRALPGLTTATSFEPWLFTIAHNVAVTRAERAGRVGSPPSPVHEEAFGSFDVPDPSRLDNPELVAGDHEAAALVWEAATALNARDYALLDLHVRQGLESADIATLMGVSKGNASTMVSRMKTAAAGVIGSYIVARRGSKDCEELQKVLAAFEFPPYTEPVRKAVDAHINDCETCQAARRMLAAPLEILGAFAVVPAPLALKGDVWSNVSGAWATSGPGVPGAAGGGAGGGPLPPNPYAAVDFGAGGDGPGGGLAPMAMGGGDAWDRNKIMLFGGAVIGMLIFAFGAGAILLAAFGGGGSTGGVATATRTAAPAGTSTPAGTVTGAVSVQTATPNLTPSVTPQPTQTPTEAPPTEAPTRAATATRTAAVTPTPKVSPTREPSATRTPPGQKTPTPTPTCPANPACPG
jgi:RNA polymerase sigma factor (sigma-70 family)